VSLADPANALAQPTRNRINVNVMAGHALMTFLQTAANLGWLVPVLARKEFAAGDWQTTALTAAIPTVLLSSIFWNAILQRVSLRSYLILLWLVGGVPYLLVRWVDSYSVLLVLHICWAIGNAGWIPMGGKLLKWFYDDRVHGRVFSVIHGVGLLAGMLAGYLVGKWLADNPNAFRWVFPLAALMQLCGVVTILLVVRHVPPLPPATLQPARRMLLDPLLQVVSILRNDRAFLRYELAFMTYGAAFMICDALLPVLVTEGLKLSYDEFSESTLVVRNLAMLLAVWPWGVVHDRIGAVRMSALGFGMMAIYPLLLLVANSYWGVAIATVGFGLGISAISLTWMLGPVALAPTQELVPKYSAIHAMCVGIRGLFFQALGMGLYRISGSFAVPFILAACAFLWGARQMWRLQRDVAAVKIKAEQPDVPAVQADSPLPPRATV
jgi:MFS family permease